MAFPFIFALDTLDSASCVFQQLLQTHFILILLSTVRKPPTEIEKLLQAQELQGSNKRVGSVKHTVTKRHPVHECIIIRLLFDWVLSTSLSTTALGPQWDLYTNENPAAGILGNSREWKDVAHQILTVEHFDLMLAFTLIFLFLVVFVFWGFFLSLEIFQMFFERWGKSQEVHMNKQRAFWYFFTVYWHVNTVSIVIFSNIYVN